jgi:type IV secretory pathway VirJ component
MKRRFFLAMMFIILAGSTRVSRATSTHCPCIDQTDVDDLPLIEERARHEHGWMAVLITGDGGWRAIDRGLAGGLTSRGIPVVGLVSPDYFSSRRTPDESACALRRIIEHYSLAWRAPNVIVCGYSRGAGVLPFMLNRMPARWRSRVRIAALIGLDRTIDFEVTPADLLRSGPAPHEIPVRGEVEQLRGLRVLCIYGRRDSESLCPDLDPLLVTRIGEPGGHHFGGSCDELVRAMLTRTNRARSPAGGRT